MPHTPEVIPVRPDHVPELARICYEAFGALHDRHHTPRDFDTLETATMVLGMMAGSPAFVGFAATLGGRLVGSNFLCVADPVAGVGPITVDPSVQARGVGRTLMKAALDEAARRGIEHVRLLQEAINTASLSLYTSLGFTWRDSVAVMQAAPGAAPGEPEARAMTAADLDAADAVARARYGQSRRNEVAAALGAGLPAYVLERAGVVSAYLLPGFLGHGFAGAPGDMEALVAHAARTAPPPFQRILVPLSQGPLFSGLLRRGCRTLKVMSYMTVGPYAPPRAVWLPSVLN